MKIAYFDCVSGISGDMTLGALVDAGVPLEWIDRAIQALGVPGLQLEAETVQRHAMRALRVHVQCPHEHAHRHLSDILAMIDTAKTAGALTSNAAKLAGSIFRKLAEAEAKVHGTDIESVHFHEVGAADSIADIVGAAVGLDYLQLDAIFASAVPTGIGTIKIAHGTCSVPAPATAELLKGVPIAASDVHFELTTPTGAAILATTVKAFIPMPAMTVTTIGSGAGGRDLPNQANLLRLMIGETDNIDEHAHDHGYHHHTDEHGHEHTHDHEHEHQHDGHDHGHGCCGGNQKLRSEYDYDEIIWVLETNLDDATGEMIGYCIEKLWQAEPLDVYTTAIQMKKQRPGVKLTVLCHGKQIGRIEAILLEHTTTLGVRRVPALRDVLQREKASVETCWGTIIGKTAILPDGAKRFAPEFDSVKRIAESNNVPLDEIYTAAKAAFQQTSSETA